MKPLRDDKGRFIEGSVGVKLPRNGEDKKCLFCGTLFYAKRRDLNKGWGCFCSRSCFYKHPRSAEYKEKLAVWQRGSKSQFWKGGISKEMAIKYSSYKWQTTRDQVYCRDGYKCRQCGATEGLNCHHIIPYRIGRLVKFIFWNVAVDDLPNLVTLCRSCHKKLDNKLQKGELHGFTPILNKVS